MSTQSRERWKVVCTNLDKCPNTKQMSSFQDHLVRHGDSTSDYGFELQFGKKDFTADILVERMTWKRGVGYLIFGTVVRTSGTGIIPVCIKEKVRVTAYDPVMKTAATMERTRSRKEE